MQLFEAGSALLGGRGWVCRSSGGPSQNRREKIIPGGSGPGQARSGRREVKINSRTPRARPNRQDRAGPGANGCPWDRRVAGKGSFGPGEVGINSRFRSKGPERGVWEVPWGETELSLEYGPGRRVILAFFPEFEIKRGNQGHCMAKGAGSPPLGSGVDARSSRRRRDRSRPDDATIPLANSTRVAGSST